MFRYLSVRYRDIRVYKDVTIPLANRGTVLIKGPNGAGKSTIWELLEVFHFGSTTTKHKTDELIRKSGNAGIDVECEHNGVPYSMAYHRRSGKWKHSITSHTPDAAFVTNTQHSANETKDKVREMLNLTREEFNGAVHLSQSNEHVLIDGQPAKRKDFISEYFNIDGRYDVLKEAAVEELDKVSSQIQKIAEFSHSRQMLEEDLKLHPLVDTQSIAEIQTQLEEDLQTFQAKVTGFEIELQNHRLWTANHELANKYKEHPKLVAVLEKEIAELNSRVNQTKKALEHNARVAHVESRRTGIESQIKALADYEQFNHRELYEEQVRLDNLIKAYDNSKPLFEELSQLPQGEEKPTDLLEKEISEAKVSILNKRTRKQAIERGECPECGSKFEQHDVNVLGAEITTLEAQLEENQSFFAILDKKNRQVRRRKDLERTTATVNVATDADRNRLNQISSILPHTGQLSKLKIELTGLPSSQLLPVEDLGPIQTETSAKTEQLEDIRDSFGAWEHLPQPPTREVPEIEEALKKSTHRVEQITTQIDECKRQKGAADAQNERSRRVQAQLKLLEDQLADLPRLKRLEFCWQKRVEAYGPRGLRVKQLEAIMERVMERLPVYSGPMLNQKGVSFYHKCQAGSIEIYIKKETSDEGPLEHDISSCSGGEKRKLSVAFLLALADCRTRQKKTNVLVLDEIDGSLDEAGRYSFANNLLPMLKENYESIFVISHSEDIQQAAVFDEVWEVSTDSNYWSNIKMRAAMDYVGPVEDTPNPDVAPVTEMVEPKKKKKAKPKPKVETTSLSSLSSSV